MPKIDIEKEIRQELASYSDKNTLPTEESRLTGLYKAKIARSYNTQLASTDIQHATDLLSIAYNATPVKAGEIRVTIANIQQKIISTHGNCSLAMIKAQTCANNALDEIEDVFEELAELSTEDKIEYLKSEFLEFIDILVESTKELSNALMIIANEFDSLTTEIVGVTDSSEIMLGDETIKAEEVKQEINNFRAEQKRTESLAKSLEESVEKYNKKAMEFEKKADTADKRAFIIGLVQIGAKMMESIANVVVIAAGGTTATATRTANTTISKITEKDKKDEKDKSKDNEAKLTTKISDKKSEVSTAKKKIEEKNKDIEELKKKIEDTNKEKQSTTHEAKIKELKAILSTKEAELKKQQSDFDSKKADLENLKESMDNLMEISTEVRKQQENTASELRSIQMDFLNKADAFEKEKRKQDAELIKIVVLLEGKGAESKSIKLTLRSLELSIKALKQVTSIIKDVAFFFQNFASFMQEIGADAERIGTKVDKTKNISKRVLSKVDMFLVSQSAEWYATEDMAIVFKNAFEKGRVGMNKAVADYKDEKEIELWMPEAINRIKEISNYRENHTNDKIDNIAKQKEELEKELV